MKSSIGLNSQILQVDLSQIDAMHIDDWRILELQLGKTIHLFSVYGERTMVKPRQKSITVIFHTDKLQFSVIFES